MSEPSPYKAMGLDAHELTVQRARPHGRRGLNETPQTSTKWGHIWNERDFRRKSDKKAPNEVLTEYCRLCGKPRFAVECLPCPKAKRRK